MRRWQVRRWQVRAVDDLNDRGRRIGKAFTEAGAWRLAERRWRRRPMLRHFYDCRTYLAEGTSCGWLEVRRTSDTRTMFELLTEEANRGR